MISHVSRHTHDGDSAARRGRAAVRKSGGSIDVHCKLILEAGLKFLGKPFTWIFLLGTFSIAFAQIRLKLTPKCCMGDCSRPSLPPQVEYYSCSCGQLKNDIQVCPLFPSKVVAHNWNCVSLTCATFHRLMKMTHLEYRLRRFSTLDKWWAFFTSRSFKKNHLQSTESLVWVASWFNWSLA